MFGINLLIFALLILGHTTLWVAFVNRTHGYAWSPSRLKRLRHLHDLMVVSFPVLLVWCLGLSGPRLLLGGTWNQVTTFWWVIIALCCGGLAWLTFMTLRRRFDRLPKALITNHSVVHDIAQKLGRHPVAKGKHHFLAGIPGNQQFQVELNEKVLQVENLPHAWEGLTILHISDWHFVGTITKDFFLRVTELAAGSPADLVVFSGDLIDNMELLNWLPETFGQFQAPLGCFFILGNHDWYQEPTAIRTALSKEGWQDLGSTGVAIAYRDSTLGLAGDETPWMGHHPEFPADSDFRLLLSHTPDNICWAQSQRVNLMLSGHNHGGQVRLPGIGPVYSPSRYGCRFASGLFWEPPTLLHVSRGLAGEHPLRWRCLPEVSRLILQRPAGDR